MFYKNDRDQVYYGAEKNEFVSHCTLHREQNWGKKGDKVQEEEELWAVTVSLNFEEHEEEEKMKMKKSV